MSTRSKGIQKLYTIGHSPRPSGSMVTLPMVRKKFFYTIKMWSIEEPYEYKCDILKSKIIKYAPQNLATLNTAQTNIRIIVPSEEIYLFLNDSFLQIELEFLKNDNTRLESADNISLNCLGTLALFSELTLNTQSNKTLEKVEECFQNFVMYNLLKHSSG